MSHNKKIKTILFILCFTTVLISGCTEQYSGHQLIDEGKRLLSNGLDFYQSTLPESIESLKQYIINIPLESLFISSENSIFIESISNLNTIDESTQDYFEDYHAVADGANAIINILDTEGNMDIGFKGNREEYERVSKIVTKWSPIIGNYNNLIYSARDYDENEPETIKEYYKNLGLFCFELAIIYTHVWWKPSYLIIGKLYRGSGLNRLAFKCPSLISYILSSAYWGLCNYLNEKTTDSAKLLIDELTATKISFDIKQIFSNTK
jgi:hypothetical protein